MKLNTKILDFYASLSLDNKALPKDVEAMNPYFKPTPAVKQVIESFYAKYYSDQNKRGLILGINPGRFGAGITGIPFTDSYRLQEYCGIDFPEITRETSSHFVYDVIDAYGGAKTFYGDWFIGAVSPLGFIHKNEKGNWVNWNYYDQKDLEQILRPYIIDCLQKQSELCGFPEKAVVLGAGKNYKYLKDLNKSIKLFKTIVPLEHPRYIMQYKLREKQNYIEKFVQHLKG